METTSTPLQQPEEKAFSNPLPLCPICNGFLIQLRHFFRCSQCHFQVCESCEGGTAGDD